MQRALQMAGLAGVLCALAGPVAAQSQAGPTKGAVSPATGDAGAAPVTVPTSPVSGLPRAPAPPPPVPTGPPREFLAEAQLFYRVVSCAGDAAVPAGLDAAVVTAHCADLATRIARFQSRYATPARDFFATVRPAGLPTTVVYPFGGGDLASALITYPDAREITTMSLEHPGDPTRLAGLDKRNLKAALALFRATYGAYLANNDSASENMMKMEKGGIPGQLSFFISALAVLDYEPVALRFFRLDDAGGVVYLSDADITALARKKALKKKGSWVDTDYSEAFTNMELSFRKKGDPTAPVIVHRHLAANLANDKFRGSPLEKHLVAKGRVVAITKAASYLLWLAGFSGIRDYLLGHMAWMVSDSTGIPPRFARRAGFRQTTYGTFTGAYLPTDAKDNQVFIDLWASQKKRKLPFRYGYPDVDGHVHMMITAPAASDPARAPAPAPTPTPAGGARP